MYEENVRLFRILSELAKAAGGERQFFRVISMTVKVVNVTRDLCIFPQLHFRQLFAPPPSDILSLNGITA